MTCLAKCFLCLPTCSYECKPFCLPVVSQSSFVDTFMHSSLPASLCFCAYTNLQYPCNCLHFLVRLLSSQPACVYACLLVCLSIVLPTHMTVCLFICLHAHLYFSSISDVCLHFVSIKVSCLPACIFVYLPAAKSQCPVLVYLHGCLYACILYVCHLVSCMHFCTIVCLHVNLFLCTFPWH